MATAAAWIEHSIGATMALMSKPPPGSCERSISGACSSQLISGTGAVMAPEMIITANAKYFILDSQQDLVQSPNCSFSSDMMFDMSELQSALKKKNHGLDVTEIEIAQTTPSPNDITTVSNPSRDRSNLQRSAKLRSSVEGNAKGDRLRLSSDRADTIEAVPPSDHCSPLLGSTALCPSLLPTFNSTIR